MSSVGPIVAKRSSMLIGPTWLCCIFRYEVVISADNSVPHLLSDDEILLAFEQFQACLRPGGGVLITVRDYQNEPRGRNIVKPYGVRVEGNKDT